MTRIVLDDLESELAADPAGSAASLAFARSVGFFGPDDDMLDVYEVFVSGGVLGVYFPSSDRLLVRSYGELTLSAKATVVHELVHAFDDQHFDLDRPELSAEGDAAWAFTAAVEGTAPAFASATGASTRGRCRSSAWCASLSARASSAGWR